MTDCTALARDIAGLALVFFAASIAALIFVIHMLRKSKRLLDDARGKVRMVRLGELLLAACDEDEQSALKAIDSTRMSVAEFKEALAWPPVDTQ